MEVSNQLLFFFSTLGVFNGLLLSSYFLLFKKDKKIHDYFMGALLLMLSLRIIKSIFFYFNPDLSRDFLQLGISACFLIGPFLYFYLSSIKEKTIKLSQGTLIHLIVLFSIVIIFGTLYPYKTNFTLWVDHFIPIIYYIWLVYILISALKVSHLFKIVFRKEDSLSSSDLWVLSVFIGNMIIWIAYYTASYTSYIVGALSFSFILYLLILLLLSKRKTKKYQDKKIDDSEAKQLIQKLNDIMVSTELFTDPDLTMPQLAKKLNILSQTLSQLVNDHLEKSFTLYINEFRIKKAESLLLAYDDMKMEFIAEESGFNSKSTFYSVFKKVNGDTPANYKISQQK